MIYLRSLCKPKAARPYGLQFLGGELKRVDMNASRMGSSATVYFELPDLLPLPDCHVRTTIMNEPRRLDSFVPVFQSERIHKDS